MPDLLEVAAEPNRRRLLQLLAAGERSVTPLAEHFSVSRSAISQHLLLLKQVGLVEARKDGRNRLYRLSPGGMARLREQVAVFWTNELDLLVADAEALAGSSARSSESPEPGSPQPKTPQPKTPEP
ncbi:ArsR/SmtB family transcription factor [Sinomonas albida]|uniref:ArsR/SmtB family transcription factor n=1 Tax=Sinomonas albida TaxID=369942 RepID=UPI0010A7BCF9|nr:metalloregulator ArsR/SmtB family transcription factor [Sinomonas albida]